MPAMGRIGSCTNSSPGRTDNRHIVMTQRLGPADVDGYSTQPSRPGPGPGGHLDVAARFRATLRMVMSDEEAIRLGAIYSPQSLTVHQGRLHGDETTPGAYGFSWGEDPVREFEYDVWAMRGASRDLLRRAVRGETTLVRSDI
jgi:hypothetical protein